MPGQPAPGRAAGPPSASTPIPGGPGAAGADQRLDRRPSFHARAATVSPRQLGNLSVQVAAAGGPAGLLTNLAGTRRDLAGRPQASRVHFGRRVGGLFISNPVLGRVSEVVGSVHACRAPRGQMRGVIVISVDPVLRRLLHQPVRPSPATSSPCSEAQWRGAGAPDAARHLGQSLATPFLTTHASCCRLVRPPNPSAASSASTAGTGRPGVVLVSGMSQQAAMANFGRQRNFG